MKRKSPRAHQAHSPSPRSAKQTTSESLVQTDTIKAFRRKIKETLYICTIYLLTDLLKYTFVS